MVIMVGGPWQLVLSAAESGAADTARVAHPRLDEAPRHLQARGSSAHWCQTQCDSLAPVVGAAEEEEDEGGPQALLFASAFTSSSPSEPRTSNRLSVRSNRRFARLIQRCPLLRC